MVLLGADGTGTVAEGPSRRVVGGGYRGGVGRHQKSRHDRTAARASLACGRPAELAA